MIRLCVAASLFITVAFSRENPFFSTAENPNTIISSEKNFNKPPLQSMTYSFPDQARVLKEVTFSFQNVDGSIETRRLEVDQSIDWRSPLVISQSTNSKNTINPPVKEIVAPLKSFVTLQGNGKQLSLLSKSPMIRHFTLSDPHSIVVDFKHREIFDTYEIPLTSLPYIKAKVTNHGKFARVILILDGRHECRVNKIDQGAQVICK